MIDLPTDNSLYTPRRPIFFGRFGEDFDTDDVDDSDDGFDSDNDYDYADPTDYDDEEYEEGFDEVDVDYESSDDDGLSSFN